jgi:hypothetical protein
MDRHSDFRIRHRAPGDGLMPGAWSRHSDFAIRTSPRGPLLPLTATETYGILTFKTTRLFSAAGGIRSLKTRTRPFASRNTAMRSIAGRLTRARNPRDLSHLLAPRLQATRHPFGEYVPRKPIQPNYLRRHGTCGTPRYRRRIVTVTAFSSKAYLRQKRAKSAKINYVGSA